CLAEPLPTLDHFAQKAAALGVKATPEAFDQRFTDSAADCLQRTLAEAVSQVIVSQPPLLPLLQRFSTVDIQDSTTVALPDCLKQQTDEVVDVPVQLGVKERLGARLVAIRVPQTVAEKRRQRLLKQARKKGKKPCQARLALCAWTILVTNLPVEKASAKE